jgi:hypothetical protein
VILDSLLPEIERAVEERVESKTLAAMDAGELRDLVYKIVERQRTPAVDPIRHLSELVESAKERHRDLVDAQEHSVMLRKEVLDDLLSHLQPALPSLLGQIVVSTIFKKDDHEVRNHHDLLLGLEILPGRKQGPNGSSQIVSGRSYFIVGLQPERPGTPISGRYAIGHHHGKVDDGEGRTWCEISLVTAQAAAEQIREEHFETILARIVDRLLVVSGQKDPRRGPRGGLSHKKERGSIERHTDRIWRIAAGLQAALEALRAKEAG